MVSFSRCLLAVTAVLLAFSSANAQGTAGTLGGACVNGVTCNTGLQCLLGFCTIALPAGSEGGSCLVGNTCNTGLTCFLGFCAKTSTGGGSSGATAGTLGGVCLAGNTCNTGLSCLLGICTIGLPAGSEGGACLAGNICNTGLSCFIGICAQTSVNPAGSLGGTCVNGVTCNTGLSCLLGICTIATGLPTAGAFGGACLAGNTCNTGLSCLAGVCTIGAITTPTCKSNADCGIGQQCDKTAGTCSSWVVPALDCGNACPSGTNCRLGVCLPALPVSNCVNSCNTNNGETCIAGSCVQANAPYCSGGCSGNCFATQNGPTCVPSGPACNKTSDCMANNICSFGTCTTIPAGFANLISNSSVFASTVRDNILAELANIGASLNSFTSVSASADVKGQIAGGSFSASAGALIQLDSSITTLQNLAFAGANAAARIEAGATQTLQSLQATAAQAQLLVGVGAKAAAGSVNVAAGASLSISMGAAAAVSGAAASIAQFAALTLSGPLTVVGDMNSMFTFPANGSAVTVSNGATVKVSGGVSLTGNAGNAPISIAANGNVRATAQVSAAQFFETAANVLGAAANFTISGVAAFSGRVVEPALTIGSAATVSFAAREGSSAALIAGDVSFDTTSTLAASKLVINGTAAAGANLFFKVIRNCPLTATITYNVQGSASVAVSNGFVLFNYAASTYANVNTFKCGIQVCGTDGCLQIINPYATAGRRLLATGNQASFSPTSASVSAGSTVAVQAASQIKIASTIFALLVAFVVALMYKL